MNRFRKWLADLLDPPYHIHAQVDQCGDTVMQDEDTAVVHEGRVTDCAVCYYGTGIRAWQHWSF